MKKIFFAILFVGLPLTIFSQNLNGRFTSSFYTFERYNSADNSETFLRTYQALNANFNYNKVSLRTRLNFESNIGNALDNDPRLRFYNLYIEARDIFDLVTLKVGRQPLFTPVAGGLFDGANIKIKHAGFSLSGFYGGNVPAYQKLELTDDFGNDYVLGGRLEANAIANLRLGVSYIDKNFKPLDYNSYRLDENLDPVTVVVLSKSNQYKYLSADAAYSIASLLDINTRYEYDLNFEVTSKFEVDGRVNVTDRLGVNLYYNYREPRVRYNSIFSVFNYGNTKEYEGGADYKLSNDFTVFGKFGYVEYDNDNSSRFTVGTTTKYGSLSYRKNMGYAGEMDAVSIYSAHSFMEGFITPSVGIAFTNYKLSKDSETNNITSLLAGVNVRPWNRWSFDIQTQYFDNKIYKNDFRLLFKVNHWFNTNF
jgi:hypothetical protein